MARRDPVWAEKMARRHAEFNARRAALAAVPSPSPAAAVTSEIKAAIASEVKVAVTAALQAAFAEHLDFAPTTTAAPTPVATTVDPSIKPPVSTVLGNDPDMAASNGVDLAAPMPPTRSTNCQSRVAASSVSPAAPTSSTTTGNIVPVLAAPVMSGEALNICAVGGTAPTTPIRSLGGSDDRTGEEDPVAMSPASFTAPSEDSSNPPREALHALPSVHHVRQKRNMILWGLHRLRPPWPPPELGIIDCHIQDAAGGWVHSLEIAGRTLLNQLGKFLSSPSPIVVNDTSSPCVNGCLNDVSWRLPTCWPVTQCVQPANAILSAFSWPWITIKCVKVRSRFSYSSFPVNGHFARVPVMLSDRAHMNEKSTWETSLKLVVYLVHPVLNIAYSSSWRSIIVGCFLQYGLGADVLLLLIYCHRISLLQLFRGRYPSVYKIVLKRYSPVSSGNPIGRGLLHNTLLQDWLHSCLIGHIVQCPFELLQWKIAWSRNWECYEVASTILIEFVPFNMCEEILQANFIIVCHWVDGVAAVYEVLLPLKQLELSLSASKELYVTPLLPQFTEAMVARGTSLNQRSGMCFDLGSATTRSLLSPWDPGERAVGTKYLEVSSTELFLGTRRLMRMPVRWPSLREEEFIGSRNLSLQYIVKTMGSQLAEGFCFFLPPAKPPDNNDECILTIYSETVCALSYRLHFQWATVVQRWISLHIQQGNTHYSHLIEWSLQSEFGFYTPGDILFCYCVLLPWEIPWTVSLASRQPLLQYWSAGHEYPYCYEKFQRTIAWSLYFGCSMHGYNSMQHGSLLRKMDSFWYESYCDKHTFPPYVLLLPWDPGGITTAWVFSCPCSIGGNGFVRIQMPCNAQACKYTVLVLQCHCCIFLRRHCACEAEMTASKMAGNWNSYAAIAVMGP